MSILRYSHQKGFTIVELLIVIVVIGILASITVVAFNGITVRARNAARLAVVKQGTQAVQLALGVYSPTQVYNTLNYSNGWARACIGVGHTNLDGDSGNVPDCGRYQNDPAYVSESPAFNALLQNAGSLPDMSKYEEVVAPYGDVVTGPFIEEMTVDGKTRLVIEYNLEGDEEKCMNGPLVYGQGSSRTLTRPSSGADYSSTGDGITECRFVITDL